MPFRYLAALAALLTVSLPAFAQAPACPEGQMIETIELRIAERRQVLDFVLDGNTETRSGYSNDPAVLRREMSEMRRTRDQLLGEWHQCLIRTALDGSVPDFTPASAYTEVYNLVDTSCESCRGAREELNEAEGRLSLTLQGLEIFRETHGLDHRPDIMASDFTREERAWLEAREAYARAAALHAALEDRIWRRCRTVRPRQGDVAGDLEDLESWMSERAVNNAGTNWPDDFYANSDPDLDPDRQLVDLEGWVVIYFDPAGNLMSSADVRAAYAELLADEELRAQSGLSEPEYREAVTRGDFDNELLRGIEYLPLDPDETEVPRRFERVRRPPIVQNYNGFHSGIDSLAGDLDGALEAFRGLGIAVPDDWSLSTYGDCLAAARAANAYRDEHLLPAREARDRAASALPADGDDWEMGTFHNLEQQVLETRRLRDAALARLVDCSIHQCRPRPVSQLQLEDESGTDADELTEEADEGVYGDEDDGLDGDGPVLPADVGDFTQPYECCPDCAPDTGADCEPGETPDTPDDAPDSPGDMDYADQWRDVEDMIAALGISPEPEGEVCRVDPADICSRLDNEDNQALCLTRFAIYGEYCRRADAAPSGTLQACHATCDANAERARVSHFLHVEVNAIIERNMAGAEAGQIAVVNTELDAARAELAAVEAAAAARRIHIYTNTETGETVQHDGEYFEPQPPLEYNGDMAAPPTEQQAERLAILPDRIAGFEAEIAELEAAMAGRQRWYDRSIGVWNGNDRAQSSVAACALDEIEPELAQCRARCDAQAQYGDFVSPEIICRDMNVIMLLDTPRSRRWIYPPE